MEVFVGRGAVPLALRGLASAVLHAHTSAASKAVSNWGGVRVGEDA